MAFIDEDIAVSIKFNKLLKSARSRDKEFSLSLNDIRKLLRRKTCALTGVVLTEPRSGDGVSNPELRATDRTIDRFDNSVGYHPHNVMAVSHLANKMKENLLESKFNGTGAGHPLSCEWSFLKNFVKGLESHGYVE